MQDELLQFELQKVWTLVDLPNVMQGYTQEEGIDYDEVFAPVARIEAIRLFLAYTSYMGFIVYQIDVKSALLYGTIKEDVYVCQPPSFEDPHFPDKVYKVEKALYGLHKAPRAWYETLSTYLLENRFRRGTIDKTLFIKKDKSDILLVQVYVDDIIFGSTKKTLCLEFEQMMHKRFQMSFMGELTFFLASSPMEPNKALVKDEEADAIHVHLYKLIIGSLMYLTASRPNIMFAVCACARDSPFDLEAFSDSDYAGASLDRKSTTGGCQFLGRRLISWQCKKQTIVANSTTQALVPYDQRNNPPQHQRIVYPTVLNIIYFCRFLDILRNYDPMDDEPMWVADHVFAPTSGSAITIPKTASEFAIKGNHLTLVKGNQFNGRTKTNAHKHIHEFLRICDMFKYKDTGNEVVRLMMFPLSLTGEAKTWLDELDEGTIETSDEL
ncbi:putative ribonuclease H-like domain-containing protein [Tanacetum coccineum]